MTDLITSDLVRLDAEWGTDKHDVIRGLAAVVGDAGRAGDVERLVTDAFAREATSATGLPHGIAIPHCRTTGVDVPTLAFARLSSGVDFGAKDGPAELVFLIAAPVEGDTDHLSILRKLARALVRRDFVEDLRVARTADEVVELVAHGLGLPAPAKAAPATGAPPGTRAGDAATATSAAQDRRPDDAPDDTRPIT
jgi:fructose PTS system EIIBC or EIIC component